MWSKCVVLWMFLKNATASSDEIRKLRISNNKLSHDNQVLIPILMQTIQKQNAALENYATLLDQERAERTKQVGQLECQLAQKNAELEAAMVRVKSLEKAIGTSSQMNPCAEPYQSLNTKRHPLPPTHFARSVPDSMFKETLNADGYAVRSLTKKPATPKKPRSEEARLRRVSQWIRSQGKEYDPLHKKASSAKTNAPAFVSPVEAPPVGQESEDNVKNPKWIHPSSIVNL